MSGDARAGTASAAPGTRAPAPARRGFRAVALPGEQHDRAGELPAASRSLTDGYTPPADGCASYQSLCRGLDELETDTHLHVHKENNVFFPAVLSIEHDLTTAPR